MKLAISNLGYSKNDSDKIYTLLNKYGFDGIEIAPGIFVGDNPYENTQNAKKTADKIKQEYNLDVVSMQGIWFGQTGNIFVKKEADKLAEFNKKVVDFAKELKVNNIVFGCPKNRQIPDGMTEDAAVNFFETIVKYAIENNTNIAIEANPAIYGTNFCNTSESAFNFAKKISGLKMNYDFGAFLENGEDFKPLYKNANLINHVHLSEPYLAALSLTDERKAQYKELLEILKACKYNKFVSIEMKQQDINIVEKTLDFVADIFKS